MGKIIAIGGGELRKGETEAIDKYIVNLAGNENPKLLFIPTASYDAQGYIELVENKFRELGCYVDSLCLITKSYNEEQIREKVLSSDIIYVGGGDTVRMMDKWKEMKMDQLLIEAYHKGIILSGLSAGSICWFEYGHSDSESFINKEDWDYIKAYGLGIIKAAHCPHYNEERKVSFVEMLKGEDLIGIALENNTAFVELDGEYHIIKSDKNSKAYILKPDSNDVVIEELREGKIANLKL